jgi:hypothetical protein
MNLSLYLLLPTENEVGVTPVSAQPLPGLISQPRSPVYNPHRSAGKGKGLLQASHRQDTDTQIRTIAPSALGFSAAVLANALGFLVLVSGLLLMLQIAQVSLT